MKKKLTILALILVISMRLFAQEPSTQQTIENLLESVGEELSDDTDIQEILDDLIRFKQEPLKINLATKEELMRLHLLSEVQMMNLIRFREKSGTIFSIYEMAAIDGFTPDVLLKIEPFISFDVQEKPTSKKRSSGDLFLRSNRSFSSETQSSSSKYEGSSERYYLRLKQTSANFEYGLVAEKDPGEAFFSQSNKWGFDYLSATANFRIGKTGNRIFAGDYHVQFGQGLVAWQGFSMGKSSETTQIFRSGQGVRSYSSTDENQFFRGLAGQFKFRNFTFSPIISLNRLDANLDTIDGKPYFSAFQTSGYHRYGSEITGKNALLQFTGGGHAEYSYRRWSFGVTAIYNRFDVEMIRSDEPYNQFLPNGKDNLVAGFDWKGSVKNVFMFGETAISKNSGRALLAGLMLKPAQNAELTVVYRNINKTYFSYFSNAFIESSRINDEHGFYAGLKIFPAPHWILSAYADFFKFIWIKYTTAAPSSGTEFFTQVAYNLSLKTNFYLRFFQETKEQRIITGMLKYDDQQAINRIRFNFFHILNEQISLKNRVEFSFYSKLTQELGFLVLQDITYKPTDRSYSMNGRIEYYNTDGYNSRLYAYENDILYSFSVPALYGNGVRSYFNFQRRFGERLTLWLKLANTYQFAHNDGEQKIEASTKSEIRIQIRYQF